MLGVWFQPRNQGLVITVEVSSSQRPEKARQVGKQSQSDVYFLTIVRLCYMNMHQNARRLISIIIKRFSIIFVMQINAKTGPVEVTHLAAES